jgi:hypothetical protein
MTTSVPIARARSAVGLVGLVVGALMWGGPTSAADPAAASPGAVGDTTCPQVFDASSASFYPIQPSFSAGYSVAAQKLTDDTADWAYVVSGDFPYSYWMAWYLYSTKGVPLYMLSDSDIVPDAGSTNPFVVGEPILAPERHYSIVFMPSDTPDSVISGMQADGQNVAVLPDIGSTKGVSIVFRSYWSLANDDLGDYDRFGYGGPTDTPFHTVRAYLTDEATGELTEDLAPDCGSQSQLPEALWFDPAKDGPIITFKKAEPPKREDYSDLPRFLLQTGSVAGALGSEFPPSPVADEVQFYRNVAANTPYADVAAAPPPGDPPDACGGYVFANLPNDVVSLVRIPQIPTFPDYRGADQTTLNDDDQFDLKFYSVVIYGADKQLDAVGSLTNSQLGNRQILTDEDGGATFVLYPRSATPKQVKAIAAVAEANGWNVLRSGLQTRAAPNILVVREKGPNDDWAYSLSPNSATAGAPCPQTADPTLPLPKDPPDAQVTQSNGMGLAAPQGQNCSIKAFLSGECLAAFGAQLAEDGSVWSAASSAPPEQIKP